MRKNLTFNRGERMALKYLYEKDYQIAEIAYRLNRADPTIRLELKRGCVPNEFLPNGQPVYSVKQAEQVCRRRSPEEANKNKIILLPETKSVLEKIMQMEQQLPRGAIIPEKLLILYRSLNPGNKRIEEALSNKMD